MKSLASLTNIANFVEELMNKTVKNSIYAVSV